MDIGTALLTCLPFTVQSVRRVQWATANKKDFVRGTHSSSKFVLHIDGLARCSRQGATSAAGLAGFRVQQRPWHGHGASERQGAEGETGLTHVPVGHLVV